MHCSVKDNQMIEIILNHYKMKKYYPIPVEVVIIIETILTEYNLEHKSNHYWWWNIHDSL